MIPAFNPSGFLPAGIHLTTLDEFYLRFANTTLRKELFKGLLMLIDDLKIIGCKTIYVDGSYVTTKRLPGDIDICWDERGIDLNMAESLIPALFDLDPPRFKQKQRYKSDVLPAFCLESGSRKFFVDFFQEDKYTKTPKGIIQIQI